MIKGKFTATDDFDLSGHHLKDWRYLADIPQDGAVERQFLVYNGTSWVPSDIASDDVQSIIDSLTTLIDVTTTDLETHLADLDNPHEVTVVQIGAAALVHTHIASDITDWLTYDLTALSLTSLGTVTAGGTSPRFVFGTTGGYIQHSAGQLMFYDQSSVGSFRFIGADNSIYLSDNDVSSLIFGTPSGGSIVFDASIGFVVNKKLSVFSDLVVTGGNLAITTGSATVDTIDEYTLGSGVTVEGVLIKDSEIDVDAINELTLNAGVTIEGVLIKDSEINVDVINEATGASGVTIDSVLLKDGDVSAGAVYADTVDELTASAGVTVEGTLFSSNDVDISGKLTASRVTTSGSNDAVLLQPEHTINGFPADIWRGVNLDATFTHAAGSFWNGSGSVCRIVGSVVDNGAAFLAGTLRLFEGKLDLNSANNGSAAPFQVDIINPGAGQNFINGAMRVNAFAGSSSTSDCIGLFSSMTADGAGAAYGYKGYATSKITATGSLVGVLGSVYPNSSAVHSMIVAVEGTMVGGSATARDKLMSFRGNNHVLVNGGSVIIDASGSASTPNAVSTSHLNFLTKYGELYAAGNAEIDGELFCDANESHSLIETTASPYTAADKTNIMIDATAGAIVVNLPAISGLSGNREYVVKKIDSSANTVTVTASGADTIDGSGTSVLSAQYDFVRIIAGSEWHVV